MKNGINIYSKIEKYRNALEQMPQSSNFFEREKDT